MLWNWTFFSTGSTIFSVFFKWGGDVWWPRQVLSDGNSKEPVNVHLISTAVDRGVCLCLQQSALTHTLGDLVKQKEQPALLA